MRKRISQSDNRYLEGGREREEEGEEERKSKEERKTS